MEANSCWSTMLIAAFNTMCISTRPTVTFVFSHFVWFTAEFPTTTMRTDFQTHTLKSTCFFMLSLSFWRWGLQAQIRLTMHFDGDYSTTGRFGLAVIVLLSVGSYSLRPVEHTLTFCSILSIRSFITSTSALWHMSRAPKDGQPHVYPLFNRF